MTKTVEELSGPKFLLTTSSTIPSGDPVLILIPLLWNAMARVWFVEHYFMLKILCEPVIRTFQMKSTNYHTHHFLNINDNKASSMCILYLPFSRSSCGVKMKNNWRWNRTDYCKFPSKVLPPGKQHQHIIVVSDSNNGLNSVQYTLGFQKRLLNNNVKVQLGFHLNVAEKPQKSKKKKNQSVKQFSINLF